MSARRFDGQVVLVTGAGTGIGRVVAREYAREGARLAIGARRTELLEETAREVRALDAECLIVPSDVTREADCVMLVGRTLDRYGRLDVLINNAAVPGTDMHVTDMTLDNWNTTIATNLTGPMLLTREALRRAMIPARRGNVQFFSSAAAKRIRARKAHYAVAKMGLIPLTQTLALEVSEYGVRVNCLVIGLVAGDLVDRWVARIASERGRPVDEVRQALLADIPMKRPVEPDEIAALSLYLASDAASAITGQNINVTNGAEVR
jgi:NAD(P)-dependent dehydrogenase (short-subunit alcohol dehydrogenase family)